MRNEEFKQRITRISRILFRCELVRVIRCLMTRWSPLATSCQVVTTPSEIDLLAQGSHGQFHWGLLSGRPPGATPRPKTVGTCRGTSGTACCCDVAGKPVRAGQNLGRGRAKRNPCERCNNKMISPLGGDRREHISAAPMGLDDWWWRLSKEFRSATPHFTPA